MAKRRKKLPHEDRVPHRMDSDELSYLFPNATRSWRDAAAGGGPAPRLFSRGKPVGVDRVFWVLAEPYDLDL